MPDYVEFRSVIIALFGTECLSFDSFDSFYHYSNDYLTAFPSFSIENDLQVFSVDIYSPLNPIQYV